MDHRVSPGSCVDSWIEENNDSVKRWKCSERKQKANRHDPREQFCSEFCSLLRRIQGAPCAGACVALELTVLYNSTLLTLSLSKLTETQELLIQGLARVLDVQGSQPPGSDPLTLWRVALEMFLSTEHAASVHALLCVQWALWLATCQMDKVHGFGSCHSQNETESVTGSLCSVVKSIRFCAEENSALLVIVAPMELKELVHICTVVSQGVGKMGAGMEGEALQHFLEAATLSSPRMLLAQTHLLSGLCLARLGRPQSSLQCYRNALEVDFGCKSALYQSSLVYRQLKNAQAEIETLRLLCMAIESPSSGDSPVTWTPLISPNLLLPCLIHDSIITIPSLLGIKHSLALRCLQKERMLEAAECYLDLLASFHTDAQQLVTADGDSILPRIPEIYLEAAVSMLKVRRYWDSIAISEEIVERTVRLIPERLLLDWPVEDGLRSVSVTSPCLGTEKCLERSRKTEENLNCVLWAAAAFVIQGQAYSWLNDSKEAVTSLTRSINLLAKVHVTNEVCQHECSEDNSAGMWVETLQRLKTLALASRGISFMDRKQEVRALQDFQLSLQASPGAEAVVLWLVQALWRLGRHDEAESLWKSTRTSTKAPEVVPDVSGIPSLLFFMQSYLNEKIPADSEAIQKVTRNHSTEIQT